MFRFLADDADAVQHWFSQPVATPFVTQEARLLAHMLPTMGGYRCVTLGSWRLSRQDCARAATLRHWQLGVGSQPAVDVCWDGLHLPLASASVDALVLLHGLEMVSEPHALVRECARVLGDRGQLAVFSFNPWSFWGLRQSLPLGRGPRLRSCCVPPPAARLSDWLHLLDIETLECWRYGPGFPLFGHRWCAQQRAAWRLGWLAWHAPAYALLARRRAHCPPSRQPEKPALGKSAKSGLAQPAGRGLT